MMRRVESPSTSPCSGIPSTIGNANRAVTGTMPAVYRCRISRSPRTGSAVRIHQTALVRRQPGQTARLSRINGPRPGTDAKRDSTLQSRVHAGCSFPPYALCAGEGAGNEKGLDNVTRRPDCRTSLSLSKDELCKTTPFRGTTARQSETGYRGLWAHQKP